MRWTFTPLDTARSADLGGGLRTAHAPTVHLVVLLAIVCACSASTTASRGAHARATTGGIAGLARDHDSGDPIAKAEIRIESRTFPARTTTSSDRGLYDLGHLAPGIYNLTAMFAGQPVIVLNIEVRAGATTMVDVEFTLGRPDPIEVDFANRKSAIERYRPKNLTTSVSIIEGTVNDSATRERVVGAVVTAAPGDITKTQQTISDDQGRFKFDAIAPGIYTVSAYYSIGGRAQIEVRRSAITVDGAEAVVVPLWIELGR